MGIVWLRALCSAWELVIEFIEVVHVCKKLCMFHRSCARSTRPPNNVRVQLLWNGLLSLGALNQTIPICVCIYIYHILDILCSDWKWWQTIKCAFSHRLSGKSNWSLFAVSLPEHQVLLSPNLQAVEGGTSTKYIPCLCKWWKKDGLKSCKWCFPVLLIGL